MLALGLAQILVTAAGKTDCKGTLHSAIVSIGNPASKEEPSKGSGRNTRVYTLRRRNAKKRIRFKQLAVFPAFRHKEALCNFFRGTA